MRTSSSNRFAAVLVAVLASLIGCNQLLDLEPARTDGDGDGVADPVDNCPTDPNAQQADRDHNGLGDVCDCVIGGADVDADGIDDACDDCVGAPVGTDVGGDGIDDGCEACPLATGVDRDGDGIQDACDTCVFGDAHDEDGDGVADACDKCPSVPDTMQRDADRDSLGDACDSDGLEISMGRFDGMARQDQTLWLGDVTHWSWSADGMVSDAAVRRYSSLTLTSRMLLVETTAPGTVDSGIVLVGPGVSLVSITCTIDANRRPRLYLDLASAAQSYGEPAPGQGTLRVRFTRRPAAIGTGSDVECLALDDTGTVVSRAVVESAAIPEASLRLGVISAGAIRFEYLWTAWR